MITKLSSVFWRKKEPHFRAALHDFCVEFYKQYGLSTKVIPVSAAEYGLSKAARPENSRLDKSKLVEAGFKPLPCWKDAVARFLKEWDGE
jgi:dTDP-4-dehydrorhamnose reductase